MTRDHSSNDQPSPTPRMVTIPHPARQGVAVRVFGRWLLAFHHIRDHVLTSPECDSWARIRPQLRSLAYPFDYTARVYAVKQIDLPTENKTLAAGLYQLYADAIAEAAQDSKSTGWIADDLHSTRLLGFDGVLVVIEMHVVTAFLPGHGDPYKVAQAQYDPEIGNRPLPRESRPARSGAGAELETPDERREREEREAAWTDEEYIYHRIYRTALKWLRDWNDKWRLGSNRDHSSLQNVIPRPREITFENWQQRRAECRSGQGGLP